MQPLPLTPSQTGGLAKTWLHRFRSCLNLGSRQPFSMCFSIISFWLRVKLQSGNRWLQMLSHTCPFVSLLGAQRNEVSGHRLLGYCHNRSHGHPGIWNYKISTHYSPLARLLSACNWACCIMSLYGTLWRLFWWSIQFPLCSCSCHQSKGVDDSKYPPIILWWQLIVSKNFPVCSGRFGYCC